MEQYACHFVYSVSTVDLCNVKQFQPKGSFLCFLSNCLCNHYPQLYVTETRRYLNKKCLFIQFVLYKLPVQTKGNLLNGQDKVDGHFCGNYVNNANMYCLKTRYMLTFCKSMSQMMYD